MRISEGADGGEPERRVIDGTADYGVGSSSVLLARMAEQAAGGAGRRVPAFALRAAGAPARQCVQHPGHPRQARHDRLAHRRTDPGR
ncbi:hypothetical protein LP420_21685 [Massilia sp. B-10]|nr:hypothetical protein LP420_21685 [Massilia sp. B-10]